MGFLDDKTSTDTPYCMYQEKSSVVPLETFLRPRIKSERSSGYENPVERSRTKMFAQFGEAGKRQNCE